MNKSYISFMKNYQEVDSPSLRYKLIESKNTDQRLLVQTTYPQNIPLLKLKSKTLDQHYNIRHQYLLPLERYFISEVGQPILTAIYQTGLHTLIEEVEARAQEHKCFKENQIWAILYGIISAMSSIQSLGVQCSSLSMDLIFLTENGQAKIIDPSFINGISQLQPNRYYSPEEIALLLNPNAESDIFKSNVFIVALCVLHCCLLNPCYDYIDRTSGTIDFELLEQFLQQASHTYSQDLIRLLVDMLDEELASRPDFLELEEHINRICIVQQTAGGILPVVIDIQNTRDQKTMIHQNDQISEPDIGEGIIHEPNETKIPKLELNVLQMSLSNNSSLDENKRKMFGLSQLKNLKIADSLSYSGAELEPYKPQATPFNVQDSLDQMKPKNSYFDTKYLKESSFPTNHQNQFTRSYFPYSSKTFNESASLAYTYHPTPYTPPVSNTDETGLFTSPELLSFLKVDLISTSMNENLNPN